MLYIIRNNQDFGPYDESALVTYVNNGQILLCDQARDASTGETNSVRYFLKRAKLRTKIIHKGSLTAQLKDIGSELIFPKNTIKSGQWKKDKSLLMLALIGMLPSVLMFLPLGNWGTFYMISLYFSIIWGLFFYYMFKTSQVSLKTTAIIFFLEQAFVFAAWDLIGLPKINPFYNFIESPFPLNVLGYVFGVGITEELAKLIPLLIIASRAKQPLVPQTLVYYGLMSGIAFGIFEGVQYQMGANAAMEYSDSFFHNIARLTSLPFMHAIWCGMAGYFISFAKLYPKYRRSLYTLALCIPALFHGLYDSFIGLGFIFGLIAVGITFIAVIMLTTYLKQGINYQSKLRN